MTITPALLLTWLIVVGTCCTAIGFIIGEVAAKVHYAHRHKGGHR